jgi:polyhydroxyalkanoate synthesis regulator phasin
VIDSGNHPVYPAADSNAKDCNMDRDYYRCLSDEDLAETGRNSGDELSIALGERLQDFVYDGGSEQMRQQINYLETEVDRLRARIDELNDELNMAQED